MDSLKLWIARDNCNDKRLYLYKNKPPRNVKNNCFDTIPLIEIDKTLFPKVTWENSPQQVELISSEKYKELIKLKRFWLKYKWILDQLLNLSRTKTD